MMTLPRFPLGSQQQTQHRVEWIPSADSALAAKGPLATAKKGTMPARAETLINIDMDKAAVDEAWLSGIREIDWNGDPIDSDTPYSPKVAMCRSPRVLDDVNCLEPEWFKEATKRFEAYAVRSRDDGAPITKKTNIFFNEGAAPGRAWRSAERGLPAASTTPQQALQADLATTSPALPPTNPGAPGYLGSSVSVEFPSARGRPFVWAGQALAGTTCRIRPSTTRILRQRARGPRRQSGSNVAMVARPASRRATRP